MSYFLWGSLLILASAVEPIRWVECSAAGELISLDRGQLVALVRGVHGEIERHHPHGSDRQWHLGALNHPGK